MIVFVNILGEFKIMVSVCGPVYRNEFLIIRKVVHMWPDHLGTYVLSHLHYYD